MNIDITQTKSQGVERSMQVKVAADEVRRAEDKAAKSYATKVRLPGFRPGKAPAAVVRKKFADAIRQEALQSIVQEAYKQAIESEKLQVAGQPHVHDLKFEEGEPLTFELHLEVRPELELTRLSGFKVERPATEVTEEQVEEQMENLREGRAVWGPVEEKPAPGDMVRVRLATSEADGTIPEGREYTLELGGGQAIPGVEDLIMTTAPGETKEQGVRWPDDFPDEAQRGTTKIVRVTLDEVKRKQLPDLDDSFAREVGDFESLDALRAAVREDLVSHAGKTAEAEVRQRLLEQIIEANPFDVPRVWVSELVRAYAGTYKVPESDLDKFAGEFWPIAERQIRRDLVVDTLAEKESLAATEADIDERVAEVAERRNADPGKVYASLQKGGRLKELERGITEDKVFAWLLEQNTVE